MSEAKKQTPEAVEDKTSYAWRVESRRIWEANRATFYGWLAKTPEEALEPELGASAGI